MQHEALSEKVLKAFYKVYNTLGYGFLEKVYERALIHELQSQGLKALAQRPIDVFYEGVNVGVYFADIVVEDLIIVELKAAEILADEHEAQLLNYLKASHIEVGLLLGFCRSPKVKRKVFSNEFKPFHDSALDPGKS